MTRVQTLSVTTSTVEAMLRATLQGSMREEELSKDLIYAYFEIRKQLSMRGILHSSHLTLTLRDLDVRSPAPKPPIQDDPSYVVLRERSLDRILQSLNVAEFKSLRPLELAVFPILELHSLIARSRGRMQTWRVRG